MRLPLLIILSIYCATIIHAIETNHEETCELNEDGTACIYESEETHTHKYTKEDELGHREEDLEEQEEKIVQVEEENLKEELVEVERQKHILDTHYLDEEKQIYFPLNGDGLARRNGVKKGHVAKVDVGHGKTVDVITKTMKPLLFEIPNFLSDEECEHIIKRAKDPNEGGMFSSRAKGGLTPSDNFKPTGKKGKNPGHFGYFGAYDNNKDGVITEDEIASMAHARKIITLLYADIKEMFKQLESDVFDDDKITKDEFEALDTIGLEEYLDVLWRTNPRFKERHSQQAWLFMEQWVDSTIHNIRERLVKISGLERSIIYGGEMLQVVHYTPYGHYHAHHDSETHKKSNIPCCHQYNGDVLESVGECRLCRYVTFIMYLNDVEEGGETAFPVADNATYHENTLRQHGNASADKYNLSHGCKRSQMVVKPKKGSAILWYNHMVNETTGWMGELDLYSLHGGCDVVKGEKWLSNMWIPAPYAEAKETPSIYLNVRDFELAKKQAAMEEL